MTQVLKSTDGERPKRPLMPGRRHAAKPKLSLHPWSPMLGSRFGVRVFATTWSSWML